MTLHGSTSGSHEVVDCFVRIKRGASLERLQDSRFAIEQTIATLMRKVANLRDLLACGKATDENQLVQFQGETHQARLDLAEVNMQIEQIVEGLLSAEEMLEDIMCLREVVRVRVQAECLIVFTVKITTVYRRTSYHLGTWDIYLGDKASLSTIDKGSGDGEDFRVRCSVSGFQDGVKPEVYDFHHWPDGSFCFGSNTDHLNEKVRRGEFLHTIEAMIMYLSTIKPDRIDMIPEVFKRNY